MYKTKESLLNIHVESSRLSTVCSHRQYSVYNIYQAGNKPRDLFDNTACIGKSRSARVAAKPFGIKTSADLSLFRFFAIATIFFVLSPPSFLSRLARIYRSIYFYYLVWNTLSRTGWHCRHPGHTSVYWHTPDRAGLDPAVPVYSSSILSSIFAWSGLGSVCAATRTMRWISHWYIENTAEGFRYFPYTYTGRSISASAVQYLTLRKH